MEHFYKIQQRLLQDVPCIFERSLAQKIDYKNKLIGITGPRGVGKTTLLLQHLKRSANNKNQALYISMDDIYFANSSLVDTVEQFVDEYEGHLLILDEVHKYPTWNQELKNIYDFYPKLQVIFSGSSSLDLIKGNYDLSRRGTLYKLHGLSFREYLQFTKNITFPILSLEEIIQNHLQIAESISQKIAPLKEFKDYLKAGYYPYHASLNIIDYYEKINNTINKTIHLDIAKFYSLKTNYLQYFEKILYFLATIPPGEISVNNLANYLGIDNKTVSEYLEYLKDTSLLRYLYSNSTGAKYIRKPAKVYLDNTNILFAINSHLEKITDKGQLRELFFLNQLQNINHQPQYISKGDMLIAPYTFEIGGKNKTWEQLKKKNDNYLVKDEIVLGEKNVIPLYLFGFLY